jgi:CRISPR/Cas system-associated exonuclease Cas4 (RecB family)
MVQLFVSNLDVEQLAPQRQPRTVANRDSAIGNGHYAEIELASEELGWYGKVDYLKLSHDGCEITDFKTGEEKPEHEFQMRIYELLWNFDRNRNPDSVPVKRAVLVYPNKKINISPLPAVEIEKIAQSISVRTSAALSEIVKPEPLANVSAQNCSFCSVRQMCSSYWDQSAQDSLVSQLEPGNAVFAESYMDLDVRLTLSIGSRVWRAKIVIGTILSPGTEILIHFGDLAGRWSNLLSDGLRVRLLNVFWIRPQGDEEFATPGVALRSSSELFVVPEQNS